MFLGREYERRLLTEAIASDRAELCVLYGRRRIGKSTLLQSVAADQTSSSTLYFEGLQSGNQAVQIRHFLARFAEQTGLPKPDASSWDDVFRILNWRKQSILAGPNSFQALDKSTYILIRGVPSYIGVILFKPGTSWASGPNEFPANPPGDRIAKKYSFCEPSNFIRVCFNLQNSQ
jgi:hypothetical protein